MNKARALLSAVKEETLNTLQFFQNNIEYEDQKEPFINPISPVKPAQKIEDSSNPIDFYQFYQQAIKTRVQKKLEEEEEKKVSQQYPATIHAVTINLNDDESHPPIISVSESPKSPLQNVEATPPRKLPRRRPAAKDLSSLG